MTPWYLIDYNIHGGLTTVQQVLNNWDSITNNATSMNNGFIVLEHDLFQESVEVATGYILPDALAHKPSFNIQPVVSCLNKPLSDAYIETNDNKTNPPAQSGAFGKLSFATTMLKLSSGSAVTLSSGAPGSAQTQTSKHSSALSMHLDYGVGFAVTTTIIGVIASLVTVRL